LQKKAIILIVFLIYTAIALWQAYQNLNRTEVSLPLTLSFNSNISKNTKAYRVSPQGKTYPLTQVADYYIDSNYISKIRLHTNSKLNIQENKKIGKLSIGRQQKTLYSTQLTPVNEENLKNSQSGFWYEVKDVNHPRQSVFPVFSTILNWKGDAYWLVNSFLFFKHYLPEGLLKFFLAYLFFPLAVMGVFSRLGLSAKLCKSISFIISIPTSWILTSLLLYYSILLFPLKSSYFYILVILLFYLILILIGEVKKLVNEQFERLNSMANLFKQKEIKIPISSAKEMSFAIVLIGLSIGFISMAVIRSQQLFFGSTDIMIYAGQAKAFFESPSFSFSGIYINDVAKYPRLSYHAPGFSFYLLFEYFLNDVFQLQGESLFKSMNPLLGLFCCLLSYLYFSKYSKTWAFVLSLIIASTWGFLIAFMSYHIDALRYFYLLSATILLFETLQTANKRLLIILMVICGLSGFLHSINLILSGILLATAVLFFQHQSLKLKIIDGIFVLLGFILFGGIHYVLDTFIGTGWIIGR